MEAFADVVRSGKALYIGVSEWTPDQLRAGHALARELQIPLVSNQPQYNALYRVIEAEVVPDLPRAGHQPGRVLPDRAGHPDREVPARPAAARGLAGHRRGRRRRNFIKGLLTDDVLTRVQSLAPLAEAEGLTMAQLAVAWVLQNDNVATAITGGSRPEQVTDNAEAAGQKLSAETLAGIDEALGDAVERTARWSTRRRRSVA